MIIPSDFAPWQLRGGWNEPALITTYRHGHHPRLQLHLTSTEDSIGIEKSIKLSIQLMGLLFMCHLLHASSTPHYAILPDHSSLFCLLQMFTMSLWMWLGSAYQLLSSRGQRLGSLSLLLCIGAFPNFLPKHACITKKNITEVTV